MSLYPTSEPATQLSSNKYLLLFKQAPKKWAQWMSAFDGGRMRALYDG